MNSLDKQNIGKTCDEHKKLYSHYTKRHEYLKPIKVSKETKTLVLTRLEHHKKEYERLGKITST